MLKSNFHSRLCECWCVFCHPLHNVSLPRQNFERFFVYSKTPAQRVGWGWGSGCLTGTGWQAKKYIQFTPCPKIQIYFDFGESFVQIRLTHTLESFKITSNSMRDHVSSYTIIDDLICVIGSCLYFFTPCIVGVTSLALGMKPIFWVEAMLVMKYIYFSPQLTTHAKELQLKILWRLINVTQGEALATFELNKFFRFSVNVLALHAACVGSASSRLCRRFSSSCNLLCVEGLHEIQHDEFMS